MQHAERLIEQVRTWAPSQSAVVAAGLVGSWARGDARDDSDVDVILVTATPGVYLDDERWLADFGRVEQVTREDWGLVQSIRVYYVGGPEVEFGITTPEWTRTAPVDPGTAQVVADGLAILYDPTGALAALRAAVG